MNGNIEEAEHYLESAKKIQELSGKQSFEAFLNLCEEYEKEVRECTNKLELVFGS